MLAGKVWGEAPHSATNYALSPGAEHLDRLNRDRLEALQAEAAALRQQLDELDSTVTAARAEHAALRLHSGSLRQQLKTRRRSNRQLHRELRKIRGDVGRWIGNLISGLAKVGRWIPKLISGVSAVFVIGTFALAVLKGRVENELPPLWVVVALGGLFAVKKGGAAILEKLSGRRRARRAGLAAAGALPPPRTPERYEAALADYVKAHKPDGE